MGCDGQDRKKWWGLDTPLPRDQYFFEVSDQKVEGESEDTDDEDTHDHGIAFKIFSRIQNHEAEASVRRDHFSRDQGGPPNTYTDAHAGEDFGESRFHDHLADDLPTGGTHRISRMYLLYRDWSHTSSCRDCHGRKDRQIDQEYLGKFTNAEPNDDKWQICERW